ncbi:MAG: alpha/beta fold hydrolase [Steroidobacteraceae bacterium]
MNDPATLILIPGLLSDASVWEAQAGELARHWRVEIPDHGMIDSLGGMAEAILGRAPPRFAVAGHSMGARVALEIWRRAPERVEALALLDTGAAPLAAGEAGAKETAGRWRLAAIARSQGLRTMGEEWLKVMVHPRRAADRALIERILAMFERKSPGIYEAQIRALLARPDARTLLPGITCPTLVLCGREDAWATAAQHQEMAAQIPGSHLVIVPESGHMVSLEQPAAVTAALGDWLQN